MRKPVLIAPKNYVLVSKTIAASNKSSITTRKPVLLVPEPVTKMPANTAKVSN